MKNFNNAIQILAFSIYIKYWFIINSIPYEIIKIYLKYHDESNLNKKAGLAKVFIASLKSKVFR